MRGSGHYDERGRSLGETLKNEVASTFKLLFKDVAQYSIDTELQSQMVVYQTGLEGQTHWVDLMPPDFAVSSDPISIWAKRDIHVEAGILLPLEAPLADASPCDIAPAISVEPVLEALSTSWDTINFENVQQVEHFECSIEAMTCQASETTVDAFKAPKIVGVQPDSLHVKVSNFAEEVPKFKAINDPRFYALPIKKSPIPPHRFAPAMRDVFRKALAEKAQTAPGNVQLKIVFEPMDMTLFSSIQQDEQGNLLCTPKNELLGKNQTVHKSSTNANTGSMYLVYGFRLDNKENIRALVPAQLVMKGKSNLPKKP